MSETIDAASAVESQEPVVESEVVQEGQAEGEVTQEQAQQIQQMIKQLTVKVDGKEFIEELPFEISPEHAEYLTKQIQLAKMANKRAQEKAEIEKAANLKDQQLQEFFLALKEMPEAILEDMGIDKKEMAVRILEEEAKKLEMTDEERKILELQEELQEIKRREEAALKKAQTEESERLKNQYAAQFEKDLMEALEQSKLPKNPEIISRMSQYMRHALQNNIDLSFKDIVPLVQSSVTGDLKSLVASLPVDEIEKLLGDEIVKNIAGRRKPSKKEIPPRPDDIKDTGNIEKLKDELFRRKNRKLPMKDFFDKIGK